MTFGSQHFAGYHPDDFKIETCFEDSGLLIKVGEAFTLFSFDTEEELQVFVRRIAGEVSVEAVRS